MSHDDMITIHADILQVTDAAVLVNCDDREIWLPLSQIDFAGEKGDTNTPISLPEWLAAEKGLSDRDGMTRATVTDLRTGLPKRKDDGKNCRNCVFSVLADDENEPLPFECAECTRSGLAGGTKDNWTDNGEEPDLPGDPPDTTRVTLTIISFSEDGEAALVEDRHGNQWNLATFDFTHDADDLNVGDTLLCYVQNSALAVEGCTLRPDESEAQNSVDEDGKHDVDTTPRPAEACFLKTETITVSVPLDPAERESVGDRMASALEKIAELEDDLDSYRKRVNAQIKLLNKEAESARKEWQEGKTEDEVYCDVMADYAAEAIIWLDHDTGKVMKRRPMTAEERQYRLPIPRPGDAAPTTPADEQSAPAPMDETIGTPHATNRHTCLDCGHMLDGEDGRQAEECASCSQSGSGDANNWTPRRECRTCAHSHATIDLPPCKGCALNVMPEHRGDIECWEWADTPALEPAPEENGSQTETSALMREAD